MASGFNRTEVIAMTGTKPSNLSYLDETGLVKPKKTGNPKKPHIAYSIEQVIQIKLIQRLREKLSLQGIRKVLDFLSKQNYKPSLFGCKLVLVGKEVYIVENECAFGAYVLKASETGQGQIMIHQIGELGDAIIELQQEAIKQQILDFEERAQGTMIESITQKLLPS